MTYAIAGPLQAAVFQRLSTDPDLTALVGQTVPLCRPWPREGP